MRKWEVVLARALSCLLVAGGACRAERAAAQRPDAVARIDGDVISPQEFAQTFARVRGLYRDTPAHAIPPWDQLKRAALDQIVEERLLLKEARRRGLNVAPREIDDTVTLLRRGYDDERLVESLLAEGLTVSRLRDEVAARLLAQRLLAQEAASAPAPTESDERAHFAAHQDRFATPERVRASHILVRTEEEARKLRKALKEKADFTALARNHSIAVDAKTGGDLGAFARGERPKIIEDACFGLKEGDISQVVPSDLGYHLFRIVARTPARAPVFEQARSAVQKDLARERARRVEHGLRARLLAAARVEVDEAALRRIK